MRAGLWALVRAGSDSEEDAEAFGPFTSKARAEKTRDDYDEFGVNPGYPLLVVELFPVRALQTEIRQEKQWESTNER